MLAVSIYNRKGGVGKTTISLHLAGMLSRKSEKDNVLLVDLDPQSSILGIKQKGFLPFKILSAMPEKTTAKFVLIDHPPGQEVLPTTKNVLIPFRPSVLDYAVMVKTRDYLRKKGHKAFLVCNCFDNRRIDDQEVYNHLSEKEPLTTIKQRSIYARALGMGRTIFDDELLNLYGTREARAEFEVQFNPFFKKYY